MKYLIGCVALLGVSLLTTPASAVCCGTECCNIGGICLGRGDVNEDNSCEVCDPSASQSTWTTTPGCTPDVDAGPAPVDAGPADAGSPDAGTPAADSGTPTVDAGTPAVDSGTPAVDAGTPAADSGSPALDAGTGGDDGGCSVGAGNEGSLFGAALLAMAALVLRRRRG